MKTICVFCGSSSGRDAAFVEAARQLGHLLASHGIGLVYGGSNVGLMRELADAALASGGHVTGVIPQSLVEREVAHRGLTELRITGSMHERKAIMADLADAFISMPGGYGTFDELCEILTWAQLGIHRKPVGLLNVLGYWDPFLLFLDHAVNVGFLKREHRRLLTMHPEPEGLLEILRANEEQAGPSVSKWMIDSR